MPILFFQPPLHTRPVLIVAALLGLLYLVFLLIEAVDRLRERRSRGRGGSDSDEPAMLDLLQSPGATPSPTDPLRRYWAQPRTAPPPRLREPFRHDDG